MRMHLKEDQEVQLNDLPAKLPKGQKIVTDVWGTFNGPVTIKQLIGAIDGKAIASKA